MKSNHSIVLAGPISSVPKQLLNSTWTFKVRIYMYCYTCGKEYTSWAGLVYHKQTVQTCTKAFPGLYKCNIKSATKLTEERASECMVCPKCFRKGPMEDHYRKKHKGNFTWIKCKFGCSERREETFKDHIRWHNIYSKNEYYMKPEKLEDFLITEHYDVMLVTLEELTEKRREANRKILKSMDSRPRQFKRCSFSGDIIVCR